MRKQTKLQAALTGVAALAAAGLAQAQAVPENEINHPITAAQDVTSAGVTVNAYIGMVAPDDVDYYKFYGYSGDVVTIRSDSFTTVTTVGLFNPAKYGYTLIADAVGTENPPVLENVRLDYDGVYTVAVTNAPRAFDHGGGIKQDGAESLFGDYFWGDYTLTVTKQGAAAEEPIAEEPIAEEPIAEEPAAEPISILVNADKRGPRKLNPKGNYTIDVAILSNPGFAAGSVDTSTVTFGATGEEQSLEKCDPVLKDVNGDSRVDLICHFQNRKAGWVGDETLGFVKGQTADGIAFEGSGTLNMVRAFFSK